MWQDTVIAICQAGAIVALVPIILDKEKPALSSCIMNFLFAGIISATLFTLEFWFSMTTAGLISALWLIIGLQKLQLVKSAKKPL